MNAAKHTLEAIALLETHYGSRFLFRKTHLGIWDEALRDRDPADVGRALTLVIQHHTHGAPGLAEVKRALDGQWESRKVARTDANCVPSPQTLGYEVVTCLVHYGTGEVQRAFNERGDLIEWGTQRVLASKPNVDPALAPPTQTPDRVEAEQRPQLEQPHHDDDPIADVHRIDFKDWA